MVECWPRRAIEEQARCPSSERYWINPEIRNKNGGFMKIILIGANGTIGEQVQKALAGAGH
jgi:hypothetical protein